MIVTSTAAGGGKRKQTCAAGLQAMDQVTTLPMEPASNALNINLTERCLSEAEFATAFQTHFRKTLRFLRSRGASEDLAEEVAQEAWARGWERLYQLRNPDVWMCG